MWLPLVQTLACLSLINGGLYALHLNGNSNSNSGSSSSNSGSSSATNSAASSSSSSHHSNNNKLEHSLHPTGGGSSLTVSQQQQQQQHLQHMPPHPLDAANSRYGEQLADLAQLERERLMLLGLAKQTAAAGAAATGHHGRPIVTGRIQMTPAEDAEESLASSGSDYPSLFMQQARGFMFGNVVKQPKHLSADDYDSAEYEDADTLPRRYEYGRVVQPPPLLEPHQQQQHHQKQKLQQPFEPRRHDSSFDWQVLDAEPDVEDIIPDLDSYQYLDELLAEQQLQDDDGWHHWPQQHESQPFYHGTGRMTQNPYHSLDELEANPPAALQELFEQSERQHHNGGGGSSSSSSTSNSNKQPKPHYEQSTRMHQKWQRKRAQQQFLNHQKLQQHFKQQQQQHLQQQRFGVQHSNKLPLASTLNDDASVTKQQQQQQQKQHSSATSSSSNAKPADPAAPSNANAAASTVSANSAAINNNQNKLNQLKQQDQQQQQHLLHPNHKRSGLGAGNVGANGYSPLQPPLPPVTHSIASQLMLRTARGQRQYDVPQIECPTAMDGMERFACPTPDLQGRYRCIDDHVLCDGFIDCPEGEDEDRRSCMFYKTTKAHLDVLADALLRWARGR